METWHLPVGNARQDILVNALVHMCGSELNMLQPFPHLEQPLHWLDHKYTPRKMCTWKATDSEIFTIFKHTEHQCCLYSHTLAKTFISSNPGLMGQICEPGTALLAQYVEDSKTWNDKKPTILVFDILRINDSHGNNLIEFKTAEKRYNILRSDSWGLFNPATANGLSLQWVGEYESCKHAITTNAMPCPHEIEGLLMLSDDNPWNLALELLGK
jgi:hypothetical protein